MPVRPLRRLGGPARTSLYDRLQSEALSCVWSRPEIDAVEREHRDLVLEREGNLLTAVPGLLRANLAYAFASDRAFVDHFPAMLEELLPRLRARFGTERLRFRLTHGPSRPAVEPVLRRLWFEQERVWWLFALARADAKGAGPVPRGVTFADGRPDDVDDVLAVDREAFPDTPLPREGLERAVAMGERVLLARVRGEVAGVALYSLPEAEVGYLHTLAVREAYRRRGIGAALTMRVARRLFREGAARIDLRTEDDNAGAVALYRSLGFRHAGSGIDYGRLADEREIRRRRRTKQGMLIRYGGWR